MKFWTIKPADCAVEEIEADDLQEVYVQLGLKEGAVDHGVVARTLEGWGISIVVYEYCLFADVAEQKWFSVCGQLFGGNAVLYGFDRHGETIEFYPAPPVAFYRSADDVEAAIARGEVQRPETLGWRWPEVQR